MIASWIYTVGTGRDATQDQLDKLERWTSWKSTRESTTQRSYTCAGAISNINAQGGWMDWEQPHREELENTGEWELDMSWQGVFVAQEANHILSCSKRGVTSMLKGGCHCVTPPGILYPVLVLPEWGRHEPAGMSSVKGCEDCQRSGTLLWRKAETAGDV